MIAKELITGSVPVLNPSDSIGYALKCMEESHLSHLPVTDNSMYSGLVSRRACTLDPNMEQLVDNLKADFLQVSVRESDHLYRVAEKMREYKLHLMPVIDFSQQYIGSIRSTEVVERFSRMLLPDFPGGLIVLAVENKDFMLTEIAQIVESNDARILNLFVVPFPNSSLLEITMKINSMEIGPILQTFSRYNYQITGSWSKEDAYTANLHERFDALMNYLGI